MCNAAHKSTLIERREGLMAQLSSLKYLLRQAIRGHTSTDGNLYHLLHLRSQDNPSLKKWISDNKYLSPDALDEQIGLMAKTLLRGILAEIHLAGWFSLMVDEATDVSRNEQMCICIRWVTDEYVVTIGLVHMPQTDSKTLFTEIKGALSAST